MDISKRSDLNKLTEKQLRYLPIKRAIDIILSTGAIVILSPVLVGIAVVIKLDSKGPVLFKQQRVGKNKELFEIYKFRTMRTDAPKDKPTHMLSDPDQYITSVGKFLRKTSLDELPQLFNILKGQMYLVSTRPALWNQYDLMEERDKYGVHQIAPGLTGWAQINGRDELDIPIKAKFDGEYIEKFGFWMDLKCLLGTVGSLLNHDGVIEGSTRELIWQDTNTNMVQTEKIKKKIIIGGAVVIGVISVGITILRTLLTYFKNKKLPNNQSVAHKKLKLGWFISFVISAVASYTIYVNAKRKVMLNVNIEDEDDDENKADEIEMKEKKLLSPKKILITGANSYIGMSVENWLNKSYDDYDIDSVDMLDASWSALDFSKYHVIYHVAGIAHADVGSITEEKRQLYYKVNTSLAVEVAEKAKREGVKQFIFMSSMIIYSGCKETVITKDTIPNPLNFYGDSKWQADQRIRDLEAPDFKVVVLRPPMIYGKGSKGNYLELAKLATRLPVFPIVNNRRSMLHIDNLCEFVKRMIDNEESGVYFPQNGEYSNTSDMIQMIAETKGHKIIMVPFTNLLVRLLGKLPGKIGGLAAKAFGDLVYDMNMSEYKEDYRVHSLSQSIELTEK